METWSTAALGEGNFDESSKAAKESAVQQQKGVVDAKGKEGGGKKEKKMGRNIRGSGANFPRRVGWVLQGC